MKKEFQLESFARVLISLLCLCLCITVSASSLVINMAQWENMPGYRMQVMKMVLALLFFLPCLLDWKKIPLEAMALAVYLVWSVVVPVVHGELSLALSGAIRLTASVFTVFLTGIVLKGKYRERMLTLFTAFVCILLSVWAKYAFQVVLTDIKEIPLTDLTIHMEEMYPDNPLRYQRFPEFFLVNRNISAVWFMNGFWLLSIQWAACKRKLWRIPMALVMGVMYLVIALQHCRTVYIAMAIGAGMLAMLLLMPRIKDRKLYQQILIVGIGAALAMGITYKGFGLSERALLQFRQVQTVSSEMETEVLQAREEGKKTAASDSNSAVIADNRQLKDDIGNMGGRKTVWKLAWKVAANNWRTFLFGQPEKSIAENLQAAGGLQWQPAHTHNLFLQLLAQYGLVGFLAGVVFMLALVLRMIRLYFGPGELHKKILTIALTCLILHGLMEPLLCGVESTSVQFALIAGVFVGICMDQEKADTQSQNGVGEVIADEQ